MKAKQCQIQASIFNQLKVLKNQKSPQRLINTDEPQDFSESYRKLNFQLKEALKSCYDNGSQQQKLPLITTSGSKGRY